MKFVLQTVCVSPHQLPLARELVRRLGADEFRYVYAEKLDSGRTDLGWHEETESWIARADADSAAGWVENCEVLLSGIRDFDLFERRAAHGLVTLYMSERWYKPIEKKLLGCRLWIPGRVKLLHPGFRRMVGRFIRLMRARTNFHYLPISMNAAHDALTMLGVVAEFERVAGGRPVGLDLPLWLWGYFVSPSEFSSAMLRELRVRQIKEVSGGVRPLRILWVGRMLSLKNVDTLLRALARVVPVRNATVTLVGDGPEKLRLIRLAEKLGLGALVEFRPFVPIEQVRSLMREHDLYVFPSNSFDGWGAVVSEAIEEQMPILASRESGAGATVLPSACTFNCHDADRLARLICSFDTLPLVDGSPWSVASAVDTLLSHAFIRTEKMV